MIQHNAGLTDSHPYASGPINWPFLLSGISFWTSPGTDREQIYMIGNVVDWWFCVLALSVFVGILGAEQIARRRGVQAVPERKLLFPAFFLLSVAEHLSIVKQTYAIVYTTLEDSSCLLGSSTMLLSGP